MTGPRSHSTPPGQHQACRHGRAADISTGAPTRAQRGGMTPRPRSPYRITTVELTLAATAALTLIWNLC